MNLPRIQTGGEELSPTTVLQARLELGRGRPPRRSGSAGDSSDVPRGEAAPPRPTDGREALEDLQVLVVDDESDARELLALLLLDKGARVTCAGSVGDAWGRLEEEGQEIQVVVTDLAMPGEDGFSLVRRLRDDPRFEELPAVALSAFQSAEDRRRTLEAGFQAHLGKPVDYAELVEVLRCVTETG